MGILWGLIAALAWGVGDFLIKSAAMRMGAARAAFFVELFSLVPLLGYFVIAGDRGVLNAWQPLALALFVGFINILATLALYMAYEIGELSVMAPIVSTFSVVTVILALVVLTERPTLLNIFGIFLTLGGIVAVSTSWSEVRRMKGIFTAQGVSLAGAAAFGLGLSFFLVDYVVDDIGYVAPVIAFRLAGVLGLLVARSIIKFDWKMPELGVWPLLITLIIVDTLGFLAYNIGISTEYVSIVSTLTSLYALISVLLALVFLGERLEINQRFGIIAVSIGIVLVLT